MTNSNKKIVKNYFILALIFLAVVLLVWYICKWYTVCNDYKKEIPVIRGTLNYEITESDFEHYILESNFQTEDEATIEIGSIRIQVIPAD